MQVDVRRDNVVTVARVRPGGYDSVADAVSELFEQAGWRLEDVIRAGDTVVLKPNWVLHENQCDKGLACMVTDASVIEAVLDSVLRAEPGRVVVGDAPVQGCDFDALQQRAGYAQVQARVAARGASVRWADFRRTVRDVSRGRVRSDVQPLSEYVLFDLGQESLLEPISGAAERFRVTMYNPDLMIRNHAPGRHQYLIARDVLDADVVINLPKLKTHKKAGVTGALKNVVGINGNKEFLPHHRAGGERSNGDCYAGGSYAKRLSERLLDGANRRSGYAARLLYRAARTSYLAARLLGADDNMDGSWPGNDTVWRMCLDLNRILLYGRADGTLDQQPVRRVLTITDAIVAGEGEGPLAASPRCLGVLTLARNPAAAEVVHTHLMGFDWRKIPLVKHAFSEFTYPIAAFRADDVELRLDGRCAKQPWPRFGEQPFVAPRQWRGQCELGDPPMVDCSQGGSALLSQEDA